MQGEKCGSVRATRVALSLRARVYLLVFLIYLGAGLNVSLDGHLSLKFALIGGGFDVQQF
jgi:hypothetical protein